jgi:nucleotide-binding universal stress UspA family protein
MDTRRRLLIPLDDSAFSREIIPHIQRWFGPEDVTITLVRVVAPARGRTGMPPRPVSSAWTAPLYESEQDAMLARHPIYASQEHASLQAAVTTSLELEARALREAGYSVSVEVAYGEPAAAIIATASTKRADMVAMATHKRGGLGRLMPGNVAEPVLRGLDIPVLLVHPAA